MFSNRYGVPEYELTNITKNQFSRYANDSLWKNLQFRQVINSKMEYQKLLEIASEIEAHSHRPHPCSWGR